MHHDRQSGAGLRQCRAAQRLLLFGSEVARYANLADKADLCIRPFDALKRLADDLVGDIALAHRFERRRMRGLQIVARAHDDLEA